MLAKALENLSAETIYTDGDGQGIAFGDVLTGAQMLTAVRAVLLAIREPELDVRMTGRNAVMGFGGSPYSDYSVAIGAGFTAMIDKILEEPA